MLETEATTGSAPMSSLEVSSNQEKNKKRSHPNDGLGPASAKRPRIKKEPPERQKEAKSPQAIAKPRDSTATVKKASPKGSVKPNWSVVSGSDSEPLQKLTKSTRVNLRPRLWSSTREELMSTFVEIAGSKCVNNISWLSTDIPILILDDESVSLEKLQDNDNELYMDVIFTRKCHYKQPFISPMGAPSNVTNDTTDPQNPVAPSQISVKENITHDDRVPEERDSNQSSVRPQNVGHPRVPETSVRHRSSATISNSVVPSGEAWKGDGLIEKAHNDESFISPQLGGHKSIGYKKDTVLASLKFKKNKTIVNTTATLLLSSQPQSEQSFSKRTDGPLLPNPPNTLSCSGHHSSLERPPAGFQIHNSSQTLPTRSACEPSKSHMSQQRLEAKPGTQALVQTSNTSHCGCTRSRFTPNCPYCNPGIPIPKLNRITENPVEAIFVETGLDLGRPTLPSKVTWTTASTFHPQHKTVDIHPGFSQLPATVPATARGPSADAIKALTSSPGKRKTKGKLKTEEKEKSPEPGKSCDNELPTSAKERSSKKPRLLKDAHVEDAQASLREVPISSSSRIKVEDLPQHSRTVQVPTGKEFKEDRVKQSILPNSDETSTGKATKRHKRKHEIEEEPTDLMVEHQSHETEADEKLPPTKGPESLMDCVNSSFNFSISSGAASTLEHKLRSEPKSHPNQATLTTSPLQKGENGVPLPIPDELQALVDAYINCTPVGIFASSRQLRKWHLNLKHREEIGYVFMGFYRVSRIWEAVEEVGAIPRERAGSNPNQETFKCQVQWRFRMGWEPGGEDWQVRERDDLSSPWWNPTLKAQGFWASPQPEKEDSDDESTTRYRLARRENLNFARRHCLFNQIFFSVLPLHLLAPVNAEIPDSAFPRGWHCRDCGKLNFRYHLRHRNCTSSYCQVKPEACGYAVELDRLRDPQDRLPSSLPLDGLPNCGRVDAKVQVWKDGMKTFFYDFGMGITESLIVVHHVFTCNTTRLQKGPSELFNLLQVHVPLRRTTGDISSSPYFTHLIDDGDDVDQANSTWDSAHEFLLRAKELMLDRVRKYVGKDDDDVNISRLDIRAWVTTGSKRGSDLLCAKQRCIIVMCLGCEAIMSISPKSAIISKDNQTHIPDLDKLIPMDSFDPKEDQLQIRSGEGVKVEAELMAKDIKPQTVSSRIPSAKVSAMSTTQKRDKMVLSVSLIHGDIMVLEGDDFEYSIKRTGTSILLIGS